MQNQAFTMFPRGIREVTEEAASRLFEAGCDDGTFCARDGVAFLHFDRHADEFTTICHSHRELAEV